MAAGRGQAGLVKVGILFDGAALLPDAAPDVAGVLESVDAVADALAQDGHLPVRVPVHELAGTWQARLSGHALERVVNLCEGIGGDASAEGELARALGRLGIPFTGSDADALDRCRRKEEANRLLTEAGLPVPEWSLADDGFDTAGWTVYPAIVKPAHEDASIGIGRGSVARSAEELAAALVTAAAHAPLLVQRYVDGRELNVAVVGDETLPAAEIEFRQLAQGAPRVVGYGAKWHYGSAEDLGTVPLCPAPLPAEQTLRIGELARRACSTLGTGGYARVDLRLDGDGRPWILEVNPNPDLSPQAGLARMATAAGWSYGELIARIVESAAKPATPRARALALARAPGTPESAGKGASKRDERDLIVVRALRGHERGDVERVLRETGVFREAEIEVGMEVLDAYYRNPDRDYTALGAFAREDVLLGYVCYGPTPATEGTFDLYWIAVSPAAQGRGVGTRLLQEVERRLARQHARLVIIETSGTPPYAPTRAFYQARGYQEVARVPDFYSDGDDRVILARRMHPTRERRQ